MSNYQNLFILSIEERLLSYSNFVSQTSESFSVKLQSVEIPAANEIYDSIFSWFKACFLKNRNKNILRYGLYFKLLGKQSKAKHYSDGSVYWTLFDHFPIFVRWLINTGKMKILSSVLTEILLNFLRVHRENITYPDVGMFHRDTFGCLPDSPEFVAPKLTLFRHSFGKMALFVEWKI